MDEDLGRNLWTFGLTLIVVFPFQQRNDTGFSRLSNKSKNPTSMLELKDATETTADGIAGVET